MLRWVVVVLALEGAAWAQADQGVEIDVSSYRDRMRAYTDGQGHYLMLNGSPVRDRVHQKFEPESFFYGDGKTMYQLSQQSADRSDVQVSFSFFDPRYDHVSKIVLAGDTAQVRCDKLEWPLTRVAEEEAAKLVASARFEVRR